MLGGGLVGVGSLLANGATAQDPLPGRGAFFTELRIEEPGFEAKLRIRLYHDPDLIQVPASAGHLFLVAADSASGREAFFIPTDMAFEIGESQLYRVEFEQASDFFGQALGGRLRPGEVQLGFILVPQPVDLGAFLPDHPESVVVRYAHHRAGLRPAPEAEVRWWTMTAEPRVLAAGLNEWWEWAQIADSAPPMDEAEARFLAERLFPGQGHLLAQESMSPEALRGAILRVEEHRLLEGPARQRVAPRYPAAARQAGISGLVVALCYLDLQGQVRDALVLASNTAHLLNLSALSAAMDWRFARVVDGEGNPADGWRLLPFQFRLIGESSLVPPVEEGGSYELPRVAKLAQPEYPEKAYNRKIEGTVIYRVTVDERGKLVQAVLEQGVHPLLDEAALMAVEQSLYVPATRGGRPVRGELLVPFTFGEKDR